MPHAPTSMTNDDYEARYDLDTLMRAKEIAANPTRIAKARAYAESEAKRLKAIAAGGEQDQSTADLMNGYRRP